MKYYSLLLIIIIFMSAFSCDREALEITDWKAYQSEYEDWKVSRLERLKSDEGWLNLAGLLWLSEGENTFGSDSSNDVVFPAGFPAFAGSVILENGSARLKALPEAGISIDGNKVTDYELNKDETTTMNQGSFRWFVIQRGDAYAIRLRDLDHPRIDALDHIPAYPFSKEYVVVAEFVPFTMDKTIEVPTVIDGYSEKYNAPGELVFEINGKKQSLVPFEYSKGFFIIFGDATNGLETYGAGRFLSTERIQGNKVLIDFNRATNPPCAFSPFATCPLPPLSNVLEVEIKAGEKAVHLD